MDVSSSGKWFRSPTVLCRCHKPASTRVPVLNELVLFLSGYGFMLLAASLIKLMVHFNYMRYILYYMFVSLLNFNSPWIMCYKKTYRVCPGCFSVRDIDLCPTISNSSEPCFKPGEKTLAAFLFMQSIGIKGGDQVTKVWVSPSLHERITDAVFHGFFLFILLGMFSVRSFKNLEASIRICFYIALMGYLVLFMIALTQQGFVYALSQLTSDYNTDAFLTLNVWLTTFRRTLIAMKLPEGGHIIFGAFFRYEDVYPQRALYTTLCFALQVICMNTYYSIFVELMRFKLNLTLVQLQLNSEECIIFVLFPTFLGIQAYGHWFSFAYFLILSLMGLWSLLFKIVVLERSITIHFNITGYYAYVRFFITSLIFASLGITITMNLYSNYYIILGHTTKFLVCNICLQLVIVYFYSLQRFCDDIQFYYKIKVSPFIKLCWVLTTILCFVELFQDDVYHEERINEVLMWTFLVIYFCPLLTGFLFEVVVLAKRKNLMGLLRPMDRFGPPDIEMRIYRLLYNPRLSDKQTQFIQTCNHSCLRNSPAVKIAIEEEVKLIKKLVMELEGSEETRQCELIERIRRPSELLGG
ncbi:hypothetical protein RUM44_004775 [Polyplax serrata]|uniref:Uncharacterized protein n=1 Tax=Polyplax serrata TaxID=468196 RepID=A0ABR1B5N0_POLSC